MLRRGAGFARGSVLLGAALLLAACSVGPDYVTPDFNLPAQWGSATTPRVSDAPPQLARWWERLNDATLNGLMDEAVEGNLDVATAKARVREARASYHQAMGALFPSLDGSGAITHARDGSRVSSGGDVTVRGDYTTYQAGLDSSWELDLFGANRRAVEAARYGVDASAEELRATLLTLVGDVATNYVEARGYQARIDLARRTAASQRDTAALTKKKLDAGGATAMDVANANGLAASTEANIPTLESSFAQSVHRLSVLTGKPPTALAERLRKTKPIPAPRLPIPAGIPADVLNARPDVRMAERQLAQSTALIGQAEANRYPSISLTGNIDTSGYKLGDLAKSSSISWAFGPTLSVPIFSGGQLEAAVRLSEAQRDQSFLAYEASVLTALEEVENSLVALKQERLRRDKLTTSASNYAKAARLSRDLYEAGSTSFLDVLDAERSLYSAADSLIQSRITLATDYVALNKALGGGWDGAIDTYTPVVADTDMGPRPAFLPKREAQ